VVLEIDELTVQRPGLRVHVAGLVVSAGQQITVIGPSGGGKSTLLRSLIGLEPVAQLRGLRWQGLDISQAPPHERPFGWLPQELGLWPHLSAAEHVAFSRTRGRHTMPVDGDQEVLAVVGLTHRMHALPADLSGGERQRLAFARVIALRPAFAVLDEPFSHLDPVMAHDLAAAFQQLARTHSIGLIQVSHQLVSPRSDEWFWVIESGKLVQSDTWKTLQSQPATPWIERFVALQPARV
jgi:ABC-type Fe3+/spermidine/putrescine transport system ATPase subunit